MFTKQRRERIRQYAGELWAQSRGRPLGLRVAILGLRGMRFAARASLDALSRPLEWALGPTLIPPLNVLLAILLKNRKVPHSVLHISYMVHIPHYTTRILRRQGLKADYLAVGQKSPWWSQYDHHFSAKNRLFKELWFFWRVVARYELIHSHFGIMLSTTGWELPVLKRMGRKIVVHYRGCEIRDPLKNQALHPQLNICQDCDYHGSVCRDGKKRTALASSYGDLFLLTTPDMRDFLPEGVHFPFFTPEALPAAPQHAPAAGRPFRIVHVTNHPGIEGTARIVEAIDKLKAKGHPIDFVFLKGVAPEEVLEAYRDADLSVGKMKMGYYANAQIESMAMGVPAVTWIRPDLMTPELAASGLILTHLDQLEQTLEHYLTHPEALEAKRQLARSSILRLHDNDRLAESLAGMYKKLLEVP